MSLYTNLEWGRFDAAREILDNYLTDFTDAKGMINMRGPETAQFGMTLSLLARYFNYTQDAAMLVKHREKIVATAAILIEMHDESLKLPKDDRGLRDDSRMERVGFLFASKARWFGGCRTSRTMRLRRAG